MGRHHEDSDGALLTVEQNMNVPIKNYYWKAVLFCTLGLINNMAGVVILAAAKSLSEDFGKKELMGLLYWANIGLGLVTKIVNLSCLLKVPVKLKMTINFFIMFAGLLITAISTQVSFEMAIGGILLIGVSSSLGESTLLGFFKHYNPSLSTSFWGLGTGLAGVCGTGMYLFFKSVLHFNNLTIFSIMVPLSLVYFASFLVLFLAFPPKSLTRDYSPQDEYDEDGVGTLPEDSAAAGLLSVNDTGVNGLMSEDGGDVAYQFDVTTNRLIPVTKSHIPNSITFDNNKASLGHVQQYEVQSPTKKYKVNAAFAYDNDNTPGGFSGSDNYGTLSPPQTSVDGSSMDSLQALKEREEQEKQRLLAQYEEDLERKDTFCTQLVNVWGFIRTPVSMLTLIYFLEYVIISLFASHSNPTTDHDTWAQKYSYEILSFCYQIGVVFSRSSIACFKFSKTWLLTLLQAVNFVVWWLHVEYLFIKPIYIQFFLMIFVGCLAGGCYSNTFYLLQTNPDLKRNKEFAINVASIGNNIGITAASVFTLVADLTFFKNKAK